MTAEDIRKKLGELQVTERAAWATYRKAEEEMAPFMARMQDLRHAWCEANDQVRGLKIMLAQYEKPNQPEATV